VKFKDVPLKFENTMQSYKSGSLKQGVKGKVF